MQNGGTDEADPALAGLDPTKARALLEGVRRRVADDADVLQLVELYEQEVTRKSQILARGMSDSAYRNVRHRLTRHALATTEALRSERDGSAAVEGNTVQLAPRQRAGPVCAGHGRSRGRKAHELPHCSVDCCACHHGVIGAMHCAYCCARSCARPACTLYGRWPTGSRGTCTRPVSLWRAGARTAATRRVRLAGRLIANYSASRWLEGYMNRVRE